MRYGRHPSPLKFPLFPPSYVHFLSPTKPFFSRSMASLEDVIRVKRLDVRCGLSSFRDRLSGRGE